VVVLLSPATVGGVELEVPEEVTGLLEVRSYGHNLMDDVFHTDNTVSACDVTTSTGTIERECRIETYYQIKNQASKNKTGYATAPSLHCNYNTCELSACELSSN